MGLHFNPSQSTNSINPSSNTASNTPMKPLEVVLEALGIKGPVTLQKEPGMQLSIDTSMSTVQVVQPSPDQAKVVELLGLGAVSYAIAVGSQDELDRIRKRLKELEEELEEKALNSEEKAEIYEAFGFNPNSESLFFQCDSGGLMFIKEGLSSLEES